MCLRVRAGSHSNEHRGQIIDKYIDENICDLQQTQSSFQTMLPTSDLVYVPLTCPKVFLMHLQYMTLENMISGVCACVRVANDKEKLLLHK